MRVRSGRLSFLGRFFGKPPARRAPRESPVTVVLTNWRRPDNVRRILDALDGQTLRPRIVLWNNGDAFDDPRVDWLVTSSENAACWPRWFLAGLTRSPFTGVMDDDLVPADGRVFENLLGFLERLAPKTVAGNTGIRLDPAKDYRAGLHMTSQPGGDLPTDMVKGRFAFLRTEDLRHVSFKPAPGRDVLVCDDIVVCGTLSGGQPGKHVLPSVLAGRFAELPDHDALCRMPDHFLHRETARRAYFSC
jgi:hypothetical protein